MKLLVFLVTSWITVSSSTVLVGNPPWASKLKTYFYSKQDKYGVNVDLVNTSALADTSFDNTKNTVFLIASWEHDYLADVNVYIRKAYVEATDYNVFIVDWSAEQPSWPTAGDVKYIGQFLGGLIKSLVRYNGLDLDKTSLVGYDYGAHLAGVAGKEIDSKAHHIVGLEPTGNNTFYDFNVSSRIDFTSARFVQIIHTCVRKGTKERLGHSDYWPNGADIQNGCFSFNSDDTDKCSHERAYWFFAESVLTGNFTARTCSDFRTYARGECNNNTKSWMGGAVVDTSVGGDFYLYTNAEPPYARGDENLE